MHELIITPKTKVAEMLDAYPQLEEILMQMTPQFKKLANPVLRHTIARVTTLGQAAIVGGVKVEKMVAVLRAEIGQTVMDIAESDHSGYVVERPDWFDESLVVDTIDTRAMLNAGEHPIHEVLSAIKILRDKQILKVVVPFIPAPMIDKTISLNYDHWLVRQDENEYWLFFRKL